MTVDVQNILESILESLERIDYIRPEDVPGIDLYMDQVTHFMEEHLEGSKRYQDDKILTKTMINNYTKNKLLPPPQKKRYSKEHMLVLIFIYYFKSFLPLGDIQAILTPVTEHFFNANQDYNIQNIYSEIYSLGKTQISETIQDIIDSFHHAANSFKDCPEEKREFMQLFSFICLLSFDIYLKKEVIEKMVDSLPRLPDDKK